MIRLGEVQPYIVEVPRPLNDLNSLEYGVHLFERLQAESLLLAGSHNEANRDQTSDPLDFRNTVKLFSLVNQVVMRQARSLPTMAVQCRGFASVPGVADVPDILLAFPDGIRKETMLTSLGRTLFRCMSADGFRLQFVDGSPLAAGYEISAVPQAQYVTESARKEFAIVWLSLELREAFRSQHRDYPLQVQLKALGIPITREDITSWLETRLNSGRRTHLPQALKSVLDDYVSTLDIVTLQKAMSGWPALEFAALVDRNSGQLLLVISDDPSALPVVLNLQPRRTQTETANANERERIDLFMASRSRWLEWPL